MRNTIFILLMLLSQWSSAGNPMSKEQCASAMKNIDENFYQLSLNIESKTNPIISAVEFLDEIQDGCELSVNEHAHIIDLGGEAYRIAYKLTGQERFFKQAKDAYEKALSANTARNEHIYWHLSMLMRTAGKYDLAIQYINRVLDMRPEPKNPLPYLQTAFQLAVETKAWNDASALIPVLQKHDKRYYRNVDLLDSTVKLLCVTGGFSDAHKLIQNVEQHVQLNDHEKNRLREIKEILKDCENKHTEA